jgi:hypothetical protein
MDFNYQNYITKYDDLKCMNYEEAYCHWTHCGIKEGRTCIITDFNYKNYITKYNDLKYMNYEQAYNHWIHCGIKEGRTCTINQVNFETHITIIIHLFKEEMFNEFLEYITNVKKVFHSVKVIFTININSHFEETIQKENSDYIILKVENKGVDIYPFLESIKYIRENDIKTDFILKLHTKENEYWRRELINPIINLPNLYILQHYFKKVKNIGYIGSQKFALPKNYDLDFPYNIQGLNELCEKFENLEKDWTDFLGGTMFWINNEVLTKYLTPELIEYFIPQFSYGKPPNNLFEKSIIVEYVCERLLTGVFCYDRTNILVNDYNGLSRSVNRINGEPDHSYFYQPSVFSFHTPKNVILN